MPRSRMMCMNSSHLFRRSSPKPAANIKTTSSSSYSAFPPPTWLPVVVLLIHVCGSRQAYRVVKQLNSSLQHHLAAAQGGAYPPEVLEQLKAIEAEMEANREQHQRIATEKKEVRALMRELRNEDGKHTHTHTHTHVRYTRLRGRLGWL